MLIYGKHHVFDEWIGGRKPCSDYTTEKISLLIFDVMGSWMVSAACNG